MRPLQVVPPAADASTLLTALDLLGYPAVVVEGEQERGRNRAAAALGDTLLLPHRGTPAGSLPAICTHGSQTYVAHLFPLPRGAGQLLVHVPTGAALEELDRLRTVNRELEVIFNSSYDELFMTDGNGTVLRASAACERHYGLKPSELEGRSVRDLERDGIFTPSATLRVIAERRRVTLMQQTATGRRLLVTANPVFDERATLIRVISNSRDVTEVLLLKQQLDEAERLNRLYSEEVQTLRKEQMRVPGLVAQSPSMRRVLELADRVASVDTTVLLLGESGVGKTLLAKTIHRLSPRASGPFVEINCGAIPDTLLESELFGYEHGAFTGTRREGKPGLVELAHGGTLFLDEVSELPPGMQVKLLKVLQDRTITRLGSGRSKRIDLRIVAASNCDLEQRVCQGAFRQDLYYRLNVVPISIPPLRSRHEDILPLIQTCLAAINRRYGLGKSLAPAALHRLLEYDWPGNVRELENVIERLVVTSSGCEITVDDLPSHLAAGRTGTGHDEEIVPLREAIAQLEARLYRLAWERCRSSYKVARLLGVSQSTAYRQLCRYLKSQGHS